MIEAIGLAKTWLTVSRAAARLGVPRATVRKFIAAGYLPAVRLLSGRRMFRLAAIDVERVRRELAGSVALVASETVGAGMGEE